MICVLQTSVRTISVDVRRRNIMMTQFVEEVSLQIYRSYIKLYGYIFRGSNSASFLFPPFSVGISSHGDEFAPQE